MKSGKVNLKSAITRLIIATSLVFATLFSLELFIIRPNSISRTFLLLLITLFLSVIISSLIGYFYFRSLWLSLRDLANSVDRLLQGGYNFPLTLGKWDEINQLQMSLLKIQEGLKLKINELQQRKTWLTAILNSIREGLIVVDSTGKIILSNASFERIIGSHRFESSLPDAQERFYWEAIRHPVITELLHQLKPETPNLNREMIMGDQVFYVNGVYTETGEKIITFSDITEVVRIAEMKRDFVTNVSHELRTPLTAIKGYIETMEDAIDEPNRKFLQIVKRHTDRLINIVSDLLTLSRLESPFSHPQFTQIDISDLINNILTIYHPLIEEKGLKFCLTLPNNIPRIIADPLYIEEALINLLDNAIKYTERGKISLAVEVIDEKIHITVEDTGIGIPEEHLPHIFERFYVVDRGRSREKGGTGLGLAIVKHIAGIHNGEIKVESTPGIGSKFTLILPINKEDPSPLLLGVR